MLFREAGMATSRLQTGDRRALLARVPIFSQLEPSEIDSLLGIATTKRLKPRDVLFRKGAEGSQLYVVVQGRLKCSTAGEEGKELVLRIMDPGEVLGDIALLDGNPRSATVTALDAAELLVIQRRDLLPFLRTHPDVAIKLLEAAAERVRRLSTLLEDTQFLNLPSRLARKLLALSDAYGVEADGGTQIELRLSQQDLGEMVGTTRESINKQLRTWTDEGVLTHENRVLTIRNEEVLEDLAQYSIL